MSVATPDHVYQERQDDWRLMRDVVAGERAIKSAGTAYLPALGGQDDSTEGRARYMAYKERASFYNATARTIDGLSGMVFRKAPMLEHPEGMDAFVDDVSLNGLPFQGFAEIAVEEVLTTDRAAILVDFPRVDATGITQARAERMNLRPFWTLYRAEDILAVRVGQIDNKTVLTQVRLHETVTEDGEDEFSEEQVEQIRVLELVDAEDSVTYQQRVFRWNDEKKQWVEFDTIVPQMRGAPLGYIPFVFLGSRDTTPRVGKPPLLDLANVNISHYRTVADLEHGAHFTALPTPYVFGVAEDNAPTEIGPEALWHSDDENVNVGLLEFSGQGLEALEKRREVKEQHMAALGARMLMQQRNQVEAAETARIRQTGEISVLASMAQAVSLGLTRAMEMARDWMGLSGDVRVDLNTDFMPVPTDPQMLQTLFQMVQAGRLSSREFFEQLQQGEIVSAEKTFEDHKSEIETDDGGGSLASLRAAANE